MSQPASVVGGYVAFTGSGDAGNRLDERHISARRLRLCVLYGVTVLLMLALRRHHEQQLARCGGCAGRADYRTVLRHRADCHWLRASRIAKQWLLLALAGLAITAEARRGLATGEDKATSLASKHRIRR